MACKKGRRYFHYQWSRANKRRGPYHQETFTPDMAPNASICQGNKCLLWIKEVSKEDCLEEAGSNLKPKKQSGLSRGSLQMPGP